jgi:hypothetical protein
MHKTAEEARRERMAVMGDLLGSQFDALWQQLVLVKSKWNEFLALFGTNEKRIELLNASAPHFFGLLQTIMWEDIVLHMARLTDPPNTFGRRDRANLTVRALPELIDSIARRDEISQQLERAIQATEFARDWRNRHIAHRDLDLALERNAEPLTAATRQSVREAFEALQSVMNAVEAHYFDSETYYEVWDSPGGALNLLHHLHHGLQYAKEREKRLERGEWDPEKDSPPEI